jgi:hypothetical protein
MKKLFLASLMLCLSILGTTHLSLAQDTKARSNDPIAQMLRQGWKIVQDGVLQRDRGAHQIETFVFGTPGFVWKLQDLQNQLRNLRLTYLATPTPELRKTILNHRQEIASTQRMITLAQAAEAKGEALVEKVSCSINFGYSASASALTSSRGVTGTASANFSSNCAFYGEVYAYSYSTAAVNGAATTQTLTDGPRSGANVTASAFTSQTGAPTCQSYAYASMTSSNLSPSSYTISATNNLCPLPPSPLNLAFAVNPASSSTAPIHLYDSDCVTVTRTATPSGGSTPYTTTIFVNGVSVGNVSTHSKVYCNTGTTALVTIPSYATVTDSAGQSKTSATVNTYIQNHKVFTPCSTCIEP